LSPGSTAGRIYIQDKCQGGLVSNLHGHQEITLNVTNGYKWLQMVTNGYKWLQMVTNGNKWFQMTNGYKWLQIVTNGKKVLIKILCFFLVGGGGSPGGKKLASYDGTVNTVLHLFFT